MLGRPEFDVLRAFIAAVAFIVCGAIAVIYFLWSRKG